MGTRVAVIGAGAWGTTMASHLAAQTEAVLWAREPEVVADIAGARRNEQFLPGFDLDDRLDVTGELAVALDGAEVVVVAVPSPYVRATAGLMAPLIDADVPVISLVKGIEADTRLRPTQVLGAVLSGHDPALIGVLSGPNLAREVMAGHPSATVVALADERWAGRIQAVVTTDSFRVYTNSDVVGCEVGGAVKNVLAIAAGMVDGMGYGWNTGGADDEGPGRTGPARRGARR